MRREAAFEGGLALVCSRQSVAPRRLVSPGPSGDALAAIVAAAGSAPDHGALQPFRVIHVADASRDRLADVFVAAKRQRQPDAAKAVLDREREKALNAPTLLVACARLRADTTAVPVAEQLISVGAAIQNMLLAAHALGFGAILLSGEKTRQPLVRDAFGLGSAELLVGFISIGSIAAASPLPAKRRPAVASYFSTWTGRP